MPLDQAASHWISWISWIRLQNRLDLRKRVADYLRGCSRMNYFFYASSLLPLPVKHLLLPDFLDQNNQDKDQEVL